jgi:hypothetical protein
LLPYQTLVLQFEFPFDCDKVFEWWTELEPKGYVGLTLKKIEVIEKTENSARVLTRWSYLGFHFSLEEKLEILSKRKWVWYSHFLGIPAKESFSLIERKNGCTLVINSVMTPQGFFKKLLFLLIGWYWRRVDVIEWNSAARACLYELSQR